MTTRYTQKTGLGLAVGLRNMPARTAGARGIARVDVLDNNPLQLRLVLDEGLKLEKRPAAMLSLVGTSNRCPRPDMLQVFQSNTARGAFSLQDQLLGNDVVVSPKSRFLAVDALQVAVGRPRAIGLQILARGVVAAAGVFHRRPGKGFAIGIAGDLHDAKVHPEKAGRRCRRSFGSLHHQQQVEGAVNQHEVFSFPRSNVGMPFGRSSGASADGTLERPNLLHARAWEPEEASEFPAKPTRAARASFLKFSVLGGVLLL
jgi:hypothetical protein